MYSTCALKAHHCRFSSSKPFSPSSSLSDSFPTANSLSPGMLCAMVKAGRYVSTALQTSPTFSSDVNKFAAYKLGICTTPSPYQTRGTHMDGALCGLDELYWEWEKNSMWPKKKKRRKKEKEIWMNSVEPNRKNLLWQRKKEKKE